MEQVGWKFDVPPDSTVVTTSYVTQERMPIVYVSHAHDPEEGIIWQCHCGNGDYDPSVLRLVRFDEILRLEPRVGELARLPVGYKATRAGTNDAWVVSPEDPEE